MDIHVNFFENIINDVQNKGNGEIIRLNMTTQKERNLIVYKLKGLKGNVCVLQLCFTIKECKIDLFHDI